MKRISRILMATIALTLLLGIMVFTTAQAAATEKTKQWGRPSATFDAKNVLLKVTVAKNRDGSTNYFWSPEAILAPAKDDVNLQPLVLEALPDALDHDAGVKPIKAVTKATAGYVDISLPDFDSAWAGNYIYIYFYQEQVTDKGVVMMPSKPKAVKLPDKPTAGEPTGVSIDYNAERLMGVGVGMQYKLDANAKSWKKGTANTLKKGISLTSTINKMRNDSGNILVRYAPVKATKVSRGVAAGFMRDQTLRIEYLKRGDAPDATVKSLNGRLYIGAAEFNYTVEGFEHKDDYIYGTAANKVLPLKDIKVSGFADDKELKELIDLHNAGVDIDVEGKERVAELLESKLEAFIALKAGKKIYVASSADESGDPKLFRTTSKQITVQAKQTKPKAGNSGDYVITYGDTPSVSAKTGKDVEFRVVDVVKYYDTTLKKVVTIEQPGVWSSSIDITEEFFTSPVVNATNRGDPDSPCDCYIQARNPGNEARLASDPVKISEKRRAAPNVTIDYLKGQFKNATTSMEMINYDDPDDPTPDWAAITAGELPISIPTLSNTDLDQTFGFRLSATSTALTSPVTLLSVKGRQDEPVLNVDYEFNVFTRTLKPKGGAILEYRVLKTGETPAWLALTQAGANLDKTLEDKARSDTAAGDLTLTVQVRTKHTANAPASDADDTLKITIPAAPSADFGRDNDDDITLNSTKVDGSEAYEWKLTTASSWTSPFSIKASTATQTLEYREKSPAADGDMAGVAPVDNTVVVFSKSSEKLLVPLPAKPKLEDFVIRYDGLNDPSVNGPTVEFKSPLTAAGTDSNGVNYTHYFSVDDGPDTLWDDADQSGYKIVDDKITFKGYDGTLPIDLKITKVADGRESEALTITIKVSGAAPKIGFTSNSDLSGSITGVNSTMEYRFNVGGTPSSGDPWTPVGSVTEIYAPKDATSDTVYQVRIKATANNPYSVIATQTVPPQTP